MEDLPTLQGPRNSTRGLDVISPSGGRNRSLWSKPSTQGRIEKHRRGLELLKFTFTTPNVRTKQRFLLGRKQLIRTPFTRSLVYYIDAKLRK